MKVMTKEKATMQNKIEIAKEKFGKLVEEQLQRVERMKADKDFIDFSSLDVIKIGICGGDGIGPAITAQAQRILEFLLADEVKNGKDAKDLSFYKSGTEYFVRVALPEGIKDYHIIEYENAYDFENVFVTG